MNTIDIKNGKIAQTLVALSIPVLIGQAFNLLYTIVDTWFIARIDQTDPWLVGATGLVFPIFFFFMAASFGISGGISSLVSRAIGAGRSKELDRTAESGFLLAIITSVIILAVIYPLSTPLLRLFGGIGQILQYGKAYLLWLLPVVPFMMLNAVFTGILQGEGRTKYIMIAMMSGTIANIVLDPVFIFGMNMGIAGAGLATAAGNAISTVYLLAVFIKLESQVKIHWKTNYISFPVIGEILRVGIPQSLMNFLNSISFIFYNRIMIDINPMILTSFTLYSRLEQFALIPIWSIMSGLGAIAGQAAGARNFDRMKRTVKVSSLIGMLVTGSLLLIFVFSSSWLFRLFQSDPEVLSLAQVIAPWMAAASFFSVPIFMITGVMSAAGFANRSLAITASRIYALNVPACIIGAYLIGKDVHSVMASIFLSSLIALLVTIISNKRFFKGLETGKLTIHYSSNSDTAG